jgi:cytoskeletal protein CcmA (bactofilin family)
MEFAMFDKHKDKKPGQVRPNEPGLTQPSAATSVSLQATGKSAVIGPGIMINGDISGSENLAIEGKVKGHIHLGSHEVTVGQSGEVNADVTAKIICVAGKVNGDLAAKEKVIIKSTGNVRGNIVTPRMLLEDGAIFKGSIDMDPGEVNTAQVSLPASRIAAKSGNAPELVADAGKKTPDHALKSG